MNHTLNDLEASERQVVAAIAQVAQQVQVIEEMEREGLSSQTARNLLMIYERTLRDLAEYRDRIALESEAEFKFCRHISILSAALMRLGKLCRPRGKARGSCRGQEAAGLK